MIEYKQVDMSYFPLYDKIPMIVNVKSHFKIEKVDRGLGGFRFVETSVEPYERNFCLGEDACVGRWKRWDLSGRAFFMAFDGEHPIGAAAVASRTEGANMLDDRNDLAALWDLRVDCEYKRRGVGRKLFEMVVEWAKAQGLAQLKIECQHNNVPAVRFYHKQGAVLSTVDEYAYYNEPEYRHEIQMIWFLDL